MSAGRILTCQSFDVLISRSRAGMARILNGLQRESRSQQSVRAAFAGDSNLLREKSMAAAATTPLTTAAPQVPTIALPKSTDDGSRIPGRRKAAILLTSLGDQASAPILRQLTEEEVHDITREISLLANVTQEERTTVLSRFTTAVESPDVFSHGGIEYATSVLLQAFGPETGKRMADRLLKSLGSDMPSIDCLRKADPKHLAKVVHREHPQTIALILCHLGTSHAAQLLTALPAELRSQVARRMAALDQISPEIINKIAKIVGTKLRTLGESSLESYGGVRAVADVLNRVESAASEEILRAISSEDPSLEQTIRHLMFLFDDFIHIGQDALRALLGRVDRKLLTMALKGCTPQVKQHFTGLMSTRAAEMLNEDMQALGPVRIKDVEEAQQQIIAIARRLQAEGVIDLQPAAAEQFVE